MRFGIILMQTRIWIWVGISMEIRIGIKTKPIHHNVIVMDKILF